jgi:LPS sulfotransferase NodH
LTNTTPTGTRNILSRGWHKLETIVGHKNYTRFIIMTRSRTGSFMLVSFLDSHPNIISQGETFRTLETMTVPEVLTRTFGRKPRRIKAVGFKIFYYHPLDADPAKVWDVLRAMPGLHVIHLKRRNILRTLTSRKIAGQTDNWWQTTPHDPAANVELAARQVEFSKEELIEGFTETRNWEQDFDRRFANHPLIEVFYEELVANPEQQLQRLTKFLGLPTYNNYQTSYRRQNPESLVDLIRNYYALKQEFQNTPWSDFFEE